MVNEMRQIAEDVLKERYYQPGEDCWDDVSLRVANYIGNDEVTREEYYQAIAGLELIPNSPCLMNAGTSNPQMSACFSINIDDSIESIFDGVKACALIHKSGGGTGINFSKIRGKGAEVKGTGHIACLTGDTVVYTNDKKIINRQQITIGELYERKQKGRNLPKKLRCMLDDYAIGKNELIDIIYSGIDTVYELKTELGYVIRATSNHRFLGIDEKWVKVKNISVGDSLAVNGNELNTSTCIRCGKMRKVRGERSKYAGMCENCVVSVFNGCSLKGSEEFHVKMSKASSGKWTDELRQKMRSRFIGENNDYFKGSDASETTARGRIRIWYPDLKLDVCCVCGNTVENGADIEIHHTDENPYNNSIENLQIICTKCHGKIHKTLRSAGNPRLFKEITFDKVISIVECGKEPVYDIQMKYPYNNFIANGFVSHNSGPVSFMHVFNQATETIKQGGKRRGANLGSLDVHHPDIKEFITCKAKEGDLSNFNISVNITDKFMQNPDPEIWDLIVDGNWKNGEPGIIFSDNAEKDNKRPELGKLEHTNPCVSGDTEIFTKEYGFQPIADFVNEEVEIWNGFEWSVVTPQITGVNQKTIIVEVMIAFESQTRNHLIKSVCCTPYHKFILDNGDRTEARELKPYDKLASFKMPNGNSISCTVHNIVDYKEKSLVHKVYCLNEPKNNSFVANGILVGNCGETRLLPWESCNLASINLMRCFIDGKFNIVKFTSLVRLGVRFLNDMIDKNRYPLPQIEEATKKTRKIGLGVMGFADLLISLGMRYGDQDSLDFADKLFKEMRAIADHESELLGGKLYNAALLSLAPTGTISLFAGVSSGIEPNFGYVYNRSTWASGEKTTYREVHPMFEAWMNSNFNEHDYNAAMNHMEQFGTLNNGAEAYGDAFEIRRLFVTAKDISPMDHVRMQAGIQKHVDQAISKCIAKGTRILTSNGYMDVETIGDARLDDTFGYPFDEELYVSGCDGKENRISSHYSGGIKPTKVIRLSNGQKIEATLNHHLMTPYGWRSVESLEIGDLIERRRIKPVILNGGKQIYVSLMDGIVNNGKVVSIPSEVSENFAKFVGMYCADGFLTESSGAIGLTCDNDRTEELFSYLVKDLFGLETRTLFDKRTEYTRNVIATSRHVARWINSYIGKGCRNKKCPIEIINGSIAERNAFLSGVSLDGYVKSHQYGKQLCIYEGYSEQLARDIFDICVSLGVVPYFGSKRVFNGNMTYGVTIDQNVFTPIDLHKNQDLTEIMRWYPMNTEYVAKYGKRRAKQKLMDGDLVVLDRSDSPKVIDNGVSYVKVTSIEDSSAEVYDIEVENTHSYNISGITSHNTINCPESTTKEEISDLIKFAWESGCKGLTIYREGSRSDVVLETNATKKVEEKKPDKKEPVTIPREIDLKSIRMNSACGILWVKTGFLHGSSDPIEVWIDAEKGGCRANLEFIGRLVSKMLQEGINYEVACKQGDKVFCSACVNNVKNESEGYSCANLISKGIKEGIKKREEDLKTTNRIDDITYADRILSDWGEEKCPECGAKLNRIEGCFTCPSCGYSRCK